MPDLERLTARPARRTPSSPGSVALFLALLGIELATAAPARACDICSVYTASSWAAAASGSASAPPSSTASSRTPKEFYRHGLNPGERMDSLISQIFAGYNQSRHRCSADPADHLPFVPPLRRGRAALRNGVRHAISDRPVRRLQHGRRARSDAPRSRRAQVPTGNPDRLKEEQEEDHDHEVTTDDLFPPGFGRPSAIGRVSHSEGESPSGIHGHDLALGSGSVDGIVGGEIFGNFDRFFATMSVQYAIRTEGSFDYTYANDLTWIGGPGYYPYLDDNMTLGVQAVLTGETKGNDEFEARRPATPRSRRSIWVPTSAPPGPRASPRRSPATCPSTRT
jgi:hypothetical protein